MTSWPEDVKEISEEDLLLWSKRLVPLFELVEDIVELIPPEDLRASHYKIWAEQRGLVEQTHLLATGITIHALDGFDHNRYSTNFAGTIAEVFAQIPYVIRRDSLWEDIANKGLRVGFYQFDIGPGLVLGRYGQYHRCKTNFVLFKRLPSNITTTIRYDAVTP